MNSQTVISIQKETIAILPKELFSGEIVVIDRREDIPQAVRELSSEPIIGFDTETRPSFQKGHSHQVSLIQLSSRTKCFLFRIHLTGFTEELKALLGNPDILKVGISLHDDFCMLHRIAEFNPQNFIELQSLVRKFDIVDLSLQKIYAIIFGKKISKTQRLTNWESLQLTEAQQRYAATDAWACIQIYDRLCSDHPEFSEYCTIGEVDSSTIQPPKALSPEAPAKSKPKRKYARRPYKKSTGNKGAAASAATLPQEPIPPKPDSATPEEGKTDTKPKRKPVRRKRTVNTEKPMEGPAEAPIKNS